MTKTAFALPLLSALVAIAAFIPLASAHGIEPARPIDARILADDDGTVSPGGCVHEAGGNDQPESLTCANAQNSEDVGGLDLLSLDAREAFLANGTPAVIFRFGVQAGNDGVIQTVQATLKSGSKAVTFGFTGPTGTYNSTTCAWVAPPVAFPGGDGEQKAVDCAMSYGALGANGTGAQLTDIKVLSLVGSTNYDQMPGTWYTKDKQDTLVPRTPPCDAPGAGCVPTASDLMGGSDIALGTYTLKGPADLLAVHPSPPAVDLRNGAGNVHLVMASSAGNLTQTVTLAMTAPPTIQASLDAATVVVSANATKTVTLNVVGATHDGAVTIVVRSDLGAYKVVSVPVLAVPPKPACGGTSTLTGSTVPLTGTPVVGSSSCPPTSSSSTTSKASGAPEMLFVGLLVFGLAGSRRRPDA